MFKQVSFVGDLHFGSECGVEPSERELEIGRRLSDSLVESGSDLVVFCGDMTNHPAPSDRFMMQSDALKCIFGNLFNKVQCYFCPGNHDFSDAISNEGRECFDKVYGLTPAVISTEIGPIIFLDGLILRSNDFESICTYLDLHFSLLQNGSNPGGLVVTHFPPYVNSVSEEGSFRNLSKETRSYLLAKSIEFGVRYFVHGHLHRKLERVHKEVQIISLPSPTHPRENQGIGYLTFRLREGSVEYLWRSVL
jgi:predicted phosphodiesterase